MTATTASRWIVGDLDRVPGLGDHLVEVAASRDVVSIPDEATVHHLVVRLQPPPAASVEDGGCLDEVVPALVWLVDQVRDGVARLAPEGSLTLVLPLESAYGEAQGTAAATVCGAAISMARTWAIELERDGVRVNTVLAETAAEARPEDVATTITALWDASPRLTGAEVVVGTGGLGRLRP